jgi:putative tricarboxylic transport membrane protein
MEVGKMKKYGDIISGSIFVIISILLLLETRKIRSLGLTMVGPQLMPIILLSLLLLTGAGVLIIGVIRLLRTQPSIGDVDSYKRATEPDNLTVIKTGVLLTIYIVLLQPIGFIIATPIYLFIQLVILGGISRRKIIIYMILSLSFTFGVYTLFFNVFYVLLPPGLLY